MDERKLGIFLWRASLEERAAAGVFWRLSKNKQLFPEERILCEKYHIDECHHGDLLRECARTLIDKRPEEAVPTYYVAGLGKLPDHLAFYVMHVTERTFVQHHNKIIKTFNDFDFPEAVDAFEIAKDDEFHHIELGRKLVKRMTQFPDGPLGRDLRMFRASKRLLGIYEAYGYVCGKECVQ